MNGITPELVIYRQALGADQVAQFHGRVNDAAGLGRALQRVQRAHGTAAALAAPILLDRIGTTAPVMTIGDPRRLGCVMFWAFQEPCQ